MDKDFSSAGTQYIICECGDNFPNESFLSIHLANGHGEVDTFLCDVCPEAFTSTDLLLQHKLTHKTETKKPQLKTLKTYNGPLAKIPEKRKEEKKPPVIKVQTLKKINSISLIQSLKTYGRFIKIEPEPDPPETPAVVESAEEPTQVLVKEEMEAEPEAEDTEEIYYQCDVCNAIFYTEIDFNVHYQSEHALKQEASQTAEQILEQHLVMDHGDNVGVQVGMETVYYYECEVGKEKSIKSERPEAAKESITDDQPTIRIDTVNSLASADKHDTVKSSASAEKDDTEIPIDHSNDQDTDRQLDNLNTNGVKFEEETKDSNPMNNLDVTDNIESEYMTDTDVTTDLHLPDNLGLLKVTRVKETKRRGRRKKNKGGRPPKEDVFANLPPGLSPSQTRKLAEERKKEIRKQQLKKAAEKYRMKTREAITIAAAEYAKRHPQVNRKASAKYAKAHPEVNRRASAKYAKAHPEVNRRAVKKYAEKKRIEKIKNDEIKQEVSVEEEIERKLECILGY